MRLGFRLAAVALPAVAGLACTVYAAPAAAQATNFRQEWTDIKNSIPGLGQDHEPIDFSERPPLVVPPTNDLPPPTAGTRLSVTDPDMMARRKALSDPRRPVPASDPGAAAGGADARAFLIDPPSGMRDPAVVAGEATSDGFKDAPKHKASHVSRHRVKRTPDVASASQ